MTITFHRRAFDDYRNWATEDEKIFARINTLISEIMHRPFTGIGKPEPLKHDLSGFWSRRITGEHRLVYQVTKDTLIIASCKFHYK
jgi:toxin YoeB